jgi:hypothetical protein
MNSCTVSAPANLSTVLLSCGTKQMQQEQQTPCNGGLQMLMQITEMWLHMDSTWGTAWFMQVTGC